MVIFVITLTVKLGAFSHSPAPSCRAIQTAGDSVGDSNYWMKPFGVNNSFEVFCHMSLLGGK